MHWMQALVFCGGLLYAAVDDLKTRTVSDIVCIIIALAGLATISPASFLGALLAMLPFYLCAGLGLMGGGDWRLAAAVGFVLGFDRVLTGFCFMAIALLLAKCWPGIKTIASDMKLSRSTVKRALADLEQHGYLKKLPRYRANGSSTSNLYSIQ